MHDTLPNTLSTLLSQTQDLLTRVNQAREAANASSRQYESVLEETRLHLAHGEGQIRHLKSESDEQVFALRSEILQAQHEFMQMREHLRAELSGQPRKEGFGHKDKREESVGSSEDAELPGESGNQ